MILCEVLEQRTRPWGYRARLIVEHLSQRGFVWFDLNQNAQLAVIEREHSEYHGNFVAVPESPCRLSSIYKLAQTEAGTAEQH